MSLKSKIFTTLLAGWFVFSPLVNYVSAEEVSGKKTKECNETFPEIEWMYDLVVEGKKVCAVLEKWNLNSHNPEMFFYAVKNTKVNVNYMDYSIEVNRRLENGSQKKLENYLVLKNAEDFSKKVMAELPNYSKEEQYKTFDKDILDSIRDLSSN